MIPEINIEEIKNKAVHSELLKAMCLINQARNIVQSAMDEKELRDAGQWDCMDETVGRLNNCANDVAYIIGTTMSGRVETLTK
ncbi:hypothetical protein NXX36_19530 [Bacteroides fragilis]|uniref:hypothetical protein n=1 Tax=Bacteroides TaxID=816 RepID=UPI001C70A1A4|nr:hypothetical protein [Bacteroides fragilis]MBW9277416.1 hypothetical protein [Bacteroides fragilis]MCE8578600.1 hypothetical protein [Bacteroides fragilis]MCE8649037.1 hypothetical protein [Bacteroides fragilis]MCM0348994.1 hypothetical protein [Bacteroides fragilis]MCM0367880.1 hypothetical protein [Bacteroides fragilis]